MLRPTGPITDFLAKLYDLSTDIEGVHFLPLMAWTGLSVGVLMLLVAALGLSTKIHILTRFAHDIFAFFVCSIYVHDGVIGALDPFNEARPSASAGDSHSYSACLWRLILTIFLVTLTLPLSRARDWSVLSPRIRGFLADYSLSLAAGLTTALSYCLPAVNVERLKVSSTGPFQFDRTGGGGWASTTNLVSRDVTSLHTVRRSRPHPWCSPGGLNSSRETRP